MSVKIAILGFAHGHVSTYVDQWVARPELGVTIVSGWDHDNTRLSDAAARVPGMKQCVSPEEALESADAVGIFAETSMHADLVELAAAAGKAIICYKPMALRMEEADRIVAAVEKYQVPFTLGFQMRTDPQNIRIREMIQAGEIGPVYLFRRRHGLSIHTWDNFENSWHCNPTYNRDILADDSSHPIDMMNWIFGLPETVSAEISTMYSPKMPNDTAVMLFKYANGMIAEITCPFACSGSEITTEVYGESGSILQSYGDAVSAGLPRPEGQPGLKYFKRGAPAWMDSGIDSPAFHGQRLVDLAEPMADFLNGKREPICTVYEGRDDLRMVLAALLSAREGCRVRIDDPRIYEL